VTRSKTLGRVVTIVLSGVVGAAVGFVLTFTHRQYVLPVAGVPIPWGLVGGLAIVAALLAGMRLAFGDRFAPLAGAAGVVLASALLAVPAGSGSVLLLDDPLGYAWAVGPTVVSLVVIAWPDRRRVSRRAT
jgi:hypothetical protein